MCVRRIWMGVLLLLTAQPASAETMQRNLCSLFTGAEITKLLGTAVEGGEPAAMGTQIWGRVLQSYT